MFKYQVIKNAVSFELANFIFNYFLLKRDSVEFMYKNNIIYDTGMFGTWTDKQVPNTYSHYADMVMEGDPWPIFIDGTGANSVIDEYKNIHKPDAPKGTKVLLEVGDMLVYSGCELEHWREPFDGNICGQVFLHYNHVNGPFADKNKFDGRPKLGLPSFVK